MGGYFGRAATSWNPRALRTPRFLTDATLCTGCKACEVACKQWNQLPEAEPLWTGNSYDNTRALSSTTWRQVLFVEQIPENRATPRWLMLSDGCKHGANAPCLEVCPTGAIIRTEFELVQKAAIAGIPILAEVSAPISLAIEAVRAMRLRLVGLLRSGRFVVYSHPERIDRVE